MNSETTSTDAGHELPTVGGSLYMEPASLIDVMFEQLEYLLEHSDGNCAPGCAECGRLAEVQSCLLRPFRPVVVPADYRMVLRQAA